MVSVISYLLHLHIHVIHHIVPVFLPNKPLKCSSLFADAPSVLSCAGIINPPTGAGTGGGIGAT